MEELAAAEYVLSLAKEQRLRDVDVVLAREESLSLRVRDGKVEKVDQSVGRGLGVRVLNEGRMGIAFTERMEQPNLEIALQAAKENATLQDPTEVEMVTRIPNVPDAATLELYNSALEELTFAQLAELGLAIEAEARAADKRVTSVPYLGVSRGTGRVTLLTSHGLRYEQRQNSVGAYCGALLEDNGARKSGSYSWRQRIWDAEAGRAVGRLAVQCGADLMGAKPLPSGALPVVLDEYCAPGLIAMFSGAFSAEAAQKGVSRLKGRLGEMLAGEDITLLDDPHKVGAPGSRYVDAEGTATQPLPLIENGRFANFLYHVESARKEGKRSTGHAGRGYTGGIGTRTHNLVLPLGTHNLEALCALPERCLLVTELEGAAGCNPLSGDISIGVQGFLMEKGQRVQPVDSVTIAGNFFDLLKQIRARGDCYQPNLSSVFIPALLVEGLTISG